MIREKITSILNEDEVTEQEDVEVEDDENVDVDVEKDVNVDVEDEVDIDDESVESDIEVKTEVPGEDADTAAVLGLLTKAQEEAEGMGDEVLMDQIGNTITYFTRKHVVKASA
jgi:exosome complex RNA-binding protein Csl4